MAYIVPVKPRPMNRDLTVYDVRIFIQRNGPTLRVRTQSELKYKEITISPSQDEKENVKEAFHQAERAFWEVYKMEAE